MFIRQCFHYCFSSCIDENKSYARVTFWAYMIMLLSLVIVNGLFKLQDLFGLIACTWAFIYIIIWLKQGGRPYDSASSQTESLIPAVDYDGDVENQNKVTESRPRQHFLDNLKVFLTVLVVAHHTVCAFGSAGDRVWYLTIGLYSNSFSQIGRGLLTINQAYFMCLFFFISSYFTPRSADKKGKEKFQYERALRLGVPLIFVMFFLVPCTKFIAQSATGNKIQYYPDPGPTWFLVWLLMLNFVYIEVRETGTENELFCVMPFPSTPKRMFIGFLCCGVLSGAMLILYETKKITSFAVMPVSIGSVPCDILMFCAGIVAFKNGWLEDKLRDKLDIPVWALYTFVLTEASVLLITLQYASKSAFMAVIFFSVAGLFCVDMCLACVVLFQEMFNNSTAFTQYFTRGAYTVYLIHPIIVTSLTICYISLYQTAEGVHLQWDNNNSSTSDIIGINNGALSLGIGCFVVFLLSNLILWPLSNFLVQLPYLKNVL